MPASVDCVLCLMRQSLEAARFVSDDSEVHHEVVRSVMELVLQEGTHVLPPLIGQKMHRLIREITHCPDPYAEGKKRFNAVLLRLLDDMRREIQEASDPFERAIRLAIAGNTIDFALGNPKPENVDQAFLDARTRPINGDVEEFRNAVMASPRILYLSDNAGEIVCDRLFIELLTNPPFSRKVTLAVRGRPVLNDATRADAEAVGLTALVPVIDNGNDGLGTMLDQCSEEFLDHFRGSDLVISKGLANYETLIENKGPILPKKIVYLFKSKCPFISHFAGTTVGDLVVRMV